MLLSIWPEAYHLLLLFSFYLHGHVHQFSLFLANLVESGCGAIFQVMR